MRCVRRLAGVLVGAGVLLFTAPQVEAATPPIPEDECIAEYVGTVGGEHWYYFECIDENGNWYHGWMVIPE